MSKDGSRAWAMDSESYPEQFRKEGELCALYKDLFIRKPIENEDLIKRINTIISQDT
jgi:hypothetical protein